MTKRKQNKRPTDRPPLGKAQPETGGRTEEQILLQEPFQVTLAGEPVTIKLLTIRPAAEWRKKFVPMFTRFLEIGDIDTDDPEAFAVGLMEYMSTKHDELLDLFFAYAVDLDREDIETTATEWEVAAALGQIVDACIAPPLLKTLAGTLEKAMS